MELILDEWEILLGIVFLDEEDCGGLELPGLLFFAYDDFADRGEAPFPAFHGDGVPRPVGLGFFSRAALRR